MMMIDPMVHLARHYFPFLLLFLLVVGFALVSLILPSLVAPRRPGGDKEKTYECGPLPLSSTTGPMMVHYYLVALLFALFDVDLLLLLPWAVNAVGLGPTVLVEVIVFVGVVMMGYLYAWREGILDWRE